MPRDTDQYDLFVSYSRADDADGWIAAFVAALQEEHRRFTGGRDLAVFFDRESIRGLDDWQHRIHHGLATSRLFLAFISPRYFASEWCRREWKAWIDVEIAKHILSEGAAPIYIIEVPGLYDSLSEQEVAHRIADLCGVSSPHAEFVESASAVVRQLRRRQLNDVQPFYHRGVEALREADLRRVLEALAADLDGRAEQVRKAAESESTVPPYNRNFSGRIEELLDLRQRLKDDRAGVITSIQGLGGIGKSELAFTYAHGFASAYPGGRFLVPCEGRASLREAVLCLGDFHAFREKIGDEDRQTVESYFAAVAACLDERLARLGHILLVLDNVAEPRMLDPQETDCLTALGPRLHLLATTRLPAPAAADTRWLTLGELDEAEALDILEKHRPFAGEAEREAARAIVSKLGGFAIAIELVAAWLAAHPDTACAQLADGWGLDAFDLIAEDRDAALRRHNHERRLGAVLGPVIRGLSPAERRALEYAAFLHPDTVALPWLRALVAADFPEVAEPGRLTDPWAECWRRLLRLAILSRAAGEDASPRIVRVHRLVADLLRRDMSPEDIAARQRAVDQLVTDRDAALEQTTRWQEVAWELEPFDALARDWDEIGHPDAAWLLGQTATRWYRLAQYTRSEPLLRRALAIDEASYGPEHPNVARDLSNLAQLLHTTNRLAEAEPLMRRALAIDEACYGPEHPNVATDLNNLAGLLQDTNRFAEAQRLLRRALAIDEASYGPEHPHLATALSNLAQLLWAMSRLAEAEPLMRRALAIDEASYGPEHPEVATDLNNLAGLLHATNRLAEAEPLMRRAVAIDEATYGPEHPKVATRLNNLAALLWATGRLAEAEPLLRRALTINEASYGPEHPDVARDLNNLARLLQSTDHLSEAEPLLRRALAISEASYGPEHPCVASVLSNLAALLHATNRLAKAEPLYRRALAIGEATYGQEHPDVARDLSNLAQLLQATNRPAEAEPLSRRALEILVSFTHSTGHEHSHLGDAIDNYARLLRAMGRSEAEVLAQLNAVAAPFGVRLGE